MIVEHLPDDLRPYDGRKPYVVASFAYQDVLRVEPWLRALAAAGVRVWFDRGTGLDRPDALERTIARSAGVLAFRSDHSVASRTVQHELDLARESGRPLFAVLLDSGVAPGGAAIAISGDSESASLVAALPAEVRDIPRAERKRAAQGGEPGAAPSSPPPIPVGGTVFSFFRSMRMSASVSEPEVSDRSRLVYLLLALICGLFGLNFLYARRMRLFLAQLALFLFIAVLPSAFPNAFADDAPESWPLCVLGGCSLASFAVWVYGLVSGTDGAGRRMAFVLPVRR